MSTIVIPRRKRDEAAGWSYVDAFQRNRGLIDESEQQILRRSHVAIAGMGGVGGVQLATLARMGIGKFTIADPDCFECANTNRQYGATYSTVNRPKTSVMYECVKDINPEAEVHVIPDAVTEKNISEFLNGADIFLDGIDFFQLPARRLCFAAARKRSIWAVTAGPVGFSSALLVFGPAGMSFDDYFDFRDDMDSLDQVIAFAVGLAPAATHLPYLDLSQVDPSSTTAPSCVLACQLASGVAAAEILKILLGRGPVRPAPCFTQFDAYRQKFRRGRLLWGNRNPYQRLKRWWLRRRFAAHASDGGGRSD